MADGFTKGVENLDGICGTGLRILLVHTRWNKSIVDALTKKTIDTMAELGVGVADIDVKSVPGSFELPFAVQTLLQKSPGRYDAAIAIGVLIKGETMHFEYIADSTCTGLMRVGLDTGVPVILGVLTCLTELQALKRAGFEGGHNHGEDWGRAAVEMALLRLSK